MKPRHYLITDWSNETGSTPDAIRWALLEDRVRAGADARRRSPGAPARALRILQRCIAADPGAGPVAPDGAVAEHRGRVLTVGAVAEVGRETASWVELCVDRWLYRCLLGAPSAADLERLDQYQYEADTNDSVKETT